MCHLLKVEGNFWWKLLCVDAQVAEKVRESGCCHCGGPLHRADYPRKPRGELGDAEEAFCRRYSFCCGDCRRRTTPPSVRFLGRKVYLGQLVVAACLAWQALGGAVKKRIGIVPLRTVLRWLAWWRQDMPQTRLWKAERAFLLPPVMLEELPRSLVGRFGKGLPAISRTLSFLSPLTTQSASWARVDLVHAEDGVG